MKLIVRNQAGIPNKYVRFIKWKLRQLNEKYNVGLYSEVYISSEGYSPQEYKATVKIGVSGPDIIITDKAHELNVLWANVSRKVKRQLRKWSDRS